MIPRSELENTLNEGYVLFSKTNTKLIIIFRFHIKSTSRLLNVVKTNSGTMMLIWYFVFVDRIVTDDHFVVRTMKLQSDLSWVMLLALLSDMPARVFTWSNHLSLGPSVTHVCDSSLHDNFIQAVPFLFVMCPKIWGNILLLINKPWNPNLSNHTLMLFSHSGSIRFLAFCANWHVACPLYSSSKFHKLDYCKGKHTWLQFLSLIFTLKKPLL